MASRSTSWNPKRVESDSELKDPSFGILFQGPKKNLKIEDAKQKVVGSAANWSARHFGTERIATRGVQLNMALESCG